MLNAGIYVSENSDSLFSAYKIKIFVKETDKSYKLKLIEFDSRYAGDHMKLVFNDKGKATIEKDKSRHTIRIWGENDFTIYPFRAGIPFYFRKES